MMEKCKTIIKNKPPADPLKPTNRATNYTRATQPSNQPLNEPPNDTHNRPTHPNHPTNRNQQPTSSTQPPHTRTNQLSQLSQPTIPTTLYPSPTCGMNSINEGPRISGSFTRPHCGARAYARAMSLVYIYI